MGYLDPTPSCAHSRKDKNHVSTSLYRQIQIMYILGILLFIGCIFIPLPNSWPADRVPWWICFVIGLAVFLIIMFIIIWKRHILKKLNVSNDNSQSLILWWSVSHVILHAVLAFLCPSKWSLWIAAGIAWEFTECYTWCWNGFLGCSGWADLCANMMGTGIGLILAYAFK